MQIYLQNRIEKIPYTQKHNLKFFCLKKNLFVTKTYKKHTIKIVTKKWEQWLRGKKNNLPKKKFKA